MGFRSRWRIIPSIYLPYNVLRVLVVIAIDILVPSSTAIGVRSIQKYAHRRTAPDAGRHRITADFLIWKSRHAGGAIPDSDLTDEKRRSMASLVDCSP